MGLERRAIRVTAVVVLLSPDGAAHAVARYEANRENPEGFHRLIGGGVEFGETGEAAVVREVAEELGAGVHDVVRHAVVESIFDYNGSPAHEIVLVHSGRLDAAAVIPPEGGMLHENGRAIPVEWRPVDASNVSIPLYPSGIDALIRDLAVGVGAPG